jgi:hypothetical protein
MQCARATGSLGPLVQSGIPRNTGVGPPSVGCNWAASSLGETFFILAQSYFIFYFLYVLYILISLKKT